MKSHLFVSFGLSLFLHFTALAAVSTVQLLYQPKKKNVKILYVNPVKLSEIRPVEVKEPDVSQPVQEQPQAPVQPPPQSNQNEVRTNDEPKPDTDKPKPRATSTPAPPAPPSPASNQMAEKPPETDPEAKAQAEKIKILKNHPYFKDWPEERLKNLEMPPGMKNWDEAVAMTDYLDNEYNWTLTPPELGGEGNGSVPVPAPTASPVPWQETAKDPVTERYEVRFYVEKTGFVSSIDEKAGNIVITYFPFEPDEESTVETEVKIPENTENIELGIINLPWRDIYREDKEALIDEILNQYRIIQEEKQIN